MIDDKKSTDPGLSAAERKTLRSREAKEAIADHEEAQRALHGNLVRLRPLLGNLGKSGLDVLGVSHFDGTARNALAKIAAVLPQDLKVSLDTSSLLVGPGNAVAADRTVGARPGEGWPRP